MTSTGLSDITMEKVREQLLYLEQVVGNKLGFTPDPIYVTPQMMLEKDDPVRRAGVVQGLQDLGYLPEMLSTDDVSGFTWAAIESAINLWRADSLGSSIKYSASFDDPYTDKKTTNITIQPDFSDPLSLLLKQTSFDGEIEVLRCPQPGEPVSLLSRIMLFRLKTLNFYDGEINAPVTYGCIETFSRMKAMLGHGDDFSNLSLLNLMGNITAVSSRFCEYYRERLFVYRDDSVAKNNRIAGNYSINWKGRSIRVMRPRGGKIHFTTIRKESPSFQYDSAKSSSQSLDEISREEINILGLELLQLRLWQHGYYTGAIDADWGKMSQAALEQFFGSCGAFEKDEKVLRGIAEGGYVLNLVYILNSLMPLAEQTVSDISHEHLKEITEQIIPDDVLDSSWQGLTQKAEEALNTDGIAFGARPVNAVIKDGYQKKHVRIFRRRRINFSLKGIKAAISGWFRRFIEELGDIQKAISAVAKKVRTFILKGFDSVMTVFRFALSSIKRVIRIASAAMNRLYFWISGKPFGTIAPDSLHYMATRWSMDFDTVNLISAGCLESVTALHMERITYMNTSFQFMITVSLEVMGVLVKIATQNWLMAANAVYKALKGLKEWNSDESPYYAYLI